MMVRAIYTLLGLTLLTGGCSSNVVYVAPEAPSQTATDVDPVQAEPQYWLSQPDTASVAGDFDSLWTAADTVSRNLLFKIDRQDRRNGVLTTEPTVSAQWFEPWRREVQSSSKLADSSVATIRRTIYFRITKEGDRYTLVPKVLVERQALTERRVSGLLTRTYFRRDTDSSGSRESDAGAVIPDSYWYAIGRDAALESKVAELVRDRLNG